MNNNQNEFRGNIPQPRIIRESSNSVIPQPRIIRSKSILEKIQNPIPR